MAEADPVGQEAGDALRGDKWLLIDRRPEEQLVGVAPGILEAGGCAHSSGTRLVGVELLDAYTGGLDASARDLELRGVGVLPADIRAVVALSGVHRDAGV